MSTRRPGFTLVELLVVIAIIGILIALLLPTVQAAIGCSQENASKGPAAPSPAAAKAALADVAANGKIGSGLMQVNSCLDALKKTDPAKAEQLSKEVQSLGKLTGKPDALKAKAKEIADIL